MSDENDTLRIDGDDTDHISLNTTSQGGSGEWTLGDFKTDAETGQTYQEYTGVSDDGSNVSIEINTQIHVDQN